MRAERVDIIKIHQHGNSNGYPLAIENKPGTYLFMHDWEEREGEERLIGIRYVCPCGCGDVRIALFDKYFEAAQGRPVWNWSEDKENPTLNPSIKRHTPCGWHGFLENGEWKRCL